MRKTFFLNDSIFNSDKAQLNSKLCSIDLNKDEAQELYSKTISYSSYDDEKDKFEICKGSIQVEYDKHSFVNITVEEVSFNFIYKEFIVAAKMLEEQ